MATGFVLGGIGAAGGIAGLAEAADADSDYGYIRVVVAVGVLHSIEVPNQQRLRWDTSLAAAAGVEVLVGFDSSG